VKNHTGELSNGNLLFFMVKKNLQGNSLRRANVFPLIKNQVYNSFKGLICNSTEANNNKKDLSMKDIFFFDAMLTPKIITFVYWLMLLGSLVSGLGTMFGGYGGSFLGGLGIIIGGAIGSRIWCELLIVLFKINENLQEITNKSE
jgi:uncharacterized protein DUF4282